MKRKVLLFVRRWAVTTMVVEAAVIAIQLALFELAYFTKFKRYYVEYLLLKDVWNELLRTLPYVAVICAVIVMTLIGIVKRRNSYERNSLL